MGQELKKLDLDPKLQHLRTLLQCLRSLLGIAKQHRPFSVRVIAKSRRQLEVSEKQTVMPKIHLFPTLDLEKDGALPLLQMLEKNTCHVFGYLQTKTGVLEYIP